MPAYRVTGTDSVVAMGQRYNPGDTFTTDAMLYPLPAGITKTSDSPAFDPILQDEVKTGGVGATGTIAIVNAVGGYKVVLKALAGSVGIKFNVVGNVETILYVEEEALVIDCLSRIVWNLIYTFKEGSSGLSVKVVKT